MKINPYLVPVLLCFTACGYRSPQMQSIHQRGIDKQVLEDSPKQEVELDTDAKPHSKTDDEEKDERDLGKGGDKEPMPSD